MNTQLYIKAITQLIGPIISPVAAQKIADKYRRGMSTRDAYLVVSLTEDQVEELTSGKQAPYLLRSPLPDLVRHYQEHGVSAPPDKLSEPFTVFTSEEHLRSPENLSTLQDQMNWMLDVAEWTNLNKVV